jgi:hypothetical protein
MKAAVVFISFGILFGFANPITIKGSISVKGNEPHTYLALTTDRNEEFSIVGKKKKEIWENYQGQVITVKGKIVRKSIGPGFPAEFDVTKIIDPKH